MDKKFFMPFETAQLLKKKGYPQDKSDYGYFDNGDIHPMKQNTAGDKQER